MKQEDKEILLQDLCSRLPYGMKAQVCERDDEDGSYFYNNCEILGIKSNSLVEFIRIDDSGKKYGRSTWFHISWFKPHLFPLSSMTEEQSTYIESLMEEIEVPLWGVISAPTHEYYDYLNKNHFDYRGLIEKGLVLDATGLNIY